jgi:cytochrome oxidase Cu insertion factor (SCO1/SenC/PrrC family)
VSRSKLCPALIALAVAAGAASPPFAHADGDPASDILVTQALFAPVDAGLSDAQRAKLTGLLGASERARLPIRVAIVASAADLGAVSEFWMQPQTYARFLGIELSLIYRGPLLVAMPDGFGINWPGHSTAAASRALAGIRVKPTGEGWLQAVQAALRDLGPSAGATGATVSGEAKTSGSSDWFDVLIAVLAAVAVLVALAAVVLRRRRHSDTSFVSRVSGSDIAAWLGWAVPVLVLALAAAIIVHSLSAGGSRRLLGADYVPENKPSIFPSHKTRAPDFSLTDEHGRPVSIAAYRGRPVIVTFVDPLSTEADPRPVQILNAAERALPSAQRPAILAVSVNVDGDARANLLRDLSKWHLLPQWRWAVGSQQQLAAVWKHYFTVVHVATGNVAGSTVRTVTHSKMAYLVDDDGYERALFGWPYGARAVEQTLESP